MYKKLVRFKEWHFAEVDPVRLKRKAETFRNVIKQRVTAANDVYDFLRLTLPVLDAAVRGEIVESVDEDYTEFVSGNFKHDMREGLLPPEYDQAFLCAEAGFAVAVQGIPLEQTFIVVIDGETYAWAELEEDGDWPGNVRFP